MIALPSTTPIHPQMDGKVRGYIYIGAFYTCVPNPLYPWDPAVVRAMRTLYPDFQPLWVNYVYQSPLDTQKREIVVGRHAYGYSKGFPNHDVEIPLPSRPFGGIKVDHPSRIEDDLSLGYKQEFNDLPGDYLPFGWWLYNAFLREGTPAGRAGTDAAVELVMQRNLARAKATEEADKAERKAEWNEFLDHQQKVYEQAGDAEISGYEKAWRAGEIRPTPKPFVDLGT